MIHSYTDDFYSAISAIDSLKSESVVALSM